MKLAKIVFSLLAMTMISAQGVIVAVNTGEFGGAVANKDNQAIAFGTGYISVGVFNGLADGLIPTSNIAAIDTAYTEFTGSIGRFGQQVGETGYGGFVNFSTTGLRVDGPDAGGTGPDAYFGKSIYVVMGNGLTLLSSTQLSIFKATIVFDDDNEAAVDSALTVNLLTTPGTWVMGGPSAVQTDVGGFPVANAATMAVVVPEPSVALLGALGIFGLIRRRR